MEDTTDVDHRNAKRVFKNLNNKNLGDYHDSCFKVIHYCLQMYLKIFEKNILKCMS